jgi:hypothetical protein
MSDTPQGGPCAGQVAHLRYVLGEGRKLPLTHDRVTIIIATNTAGCMTDALLPSGVSFRSWMPPVSGMALTF